MDSQKNIFIILPRMKEKKENLLKMNLYMIHKDYITKIVEKKHKLKLEKLKRNFIKIQEKTK